MTRRSVALLVLLLAACTRGQSEAVDLDATSTVSAFGIAFDHPADLVLRVETEQFAEYCFEPELELRHTRCLRFENDGQVVGGDPLTEELASGGVLTYVLDSVEGGSGGVEHRLSGFIDVDSDRIFVTATANDEAGHDDASWALPFIRTARR